MLGGGIVIVALLDLGLLLWSFFGLLAATLLGSGSSSGGGGRSGGIVGGSILVEALRKFREEGGVAGAATRNKVSN